MKHVIILPILLSSFISGADIQQSLLEVNDRTISISFQDNTKGKYCLPVLLQSRTIQNMFEDLGSSADDEGFPLSHINKATFDRLYRLMDFIYPQVDECTILRLITCALDNLLTVLSAANFLQVEPIILSALAKKITEKLVSQENLASFI